MKYFIKKNKHFSEGLKFGFQFKKSIFFTVIFDNSCLYENSSPDGKDINKLYGMSDSWNHMHNSIRIGWRCLNNKSIELFTFAQINKKIKFEYITTVKPNKPIGVEITIKKDKYVVNIKYDGYSYERDLPRVSKWFLPLRYMLFPYFGGNLTAPQDMKISINDKSFKMLFYLNFDKK